MIRLTENLVLTADRYSFILGEVNQTKGHSRLLSPSYYTTLSGALRGAVERSIRQAIAAERIDTLQACISEIARLTAHFEDLLAGLDTGTQSPAGYK